MRLARLAHLAASRPWSVRKFCAKASEETQVTSVRELEQLRSEGKVKKFLIHDKALSLLILLQ